MSGRSIVESLREEFLRLEGVSESGSRFVDRPAFWVNRVEIAHFDSETTPGVAVVDIRLTRAVIRESRSELREAPSVRFRASSSSDWIEVTVAGDETLVLAVTLFAKAVGAHRASAGSEPKSPPTEEQLQKLRRLH
jgi:hypothetical protein